MASSPHEAAPDPLPPPRDLPRRLAECGTTEDPGVLAGRECGAAAAAGEEAPPTDRPPASDAGYQWKGTGPEAPRAVGEHSDPGHDLAVAPTTRGTEVDLQAEGPRQTRSHEGHQGSRASHGPRQSRVGLPKDAGGTGEPGSHRLPHNRPQHPPASRHRPCSGPINHDPVADLPQVPHGLACGNGLLQCRGLDVPRRRSICTGRARDDQILVAGCCSLLGQVLVSAWRTWQENAQ